MDDTIYWLITLYCDGELFKCALQAKRDALPGDCIECPLEPENRAIIRSLLPAYIGAHGTVVAVEEISAVHIADSTVYQQGWRRD